MSELLILVCICGFTLVAHVITDRMLHTFLVFTNIYQMQSRMNAKMSFLFIVLELKIMYFDHVHWPP